MGGDYILQIAQATQDEYVLGFTDYLTARYRSSKYKTSAEEMAWAVAMLVLGLPDNDPVRFAFCETNSTQIETEARVLSKDESICELLSGAAYNIGYGHYIKSGGGRLMNRYLGFIRMQRRAHLSPADTNTMLEMGSKLDRTDPAILRSYRALKKFGIWRSRPDSPNERAYYDALKAFSAKARADILK